MSSEVAIKLDGVSKAYRIYNQPIDRLKQAIVPRLRALGRPLAGIVGENLPERNFFRSYEALQPLDLVVLRGETVGVIGQNGSGKSTLLKLICGTVEPSSGEVTTNGRIGALLELGSGFNPEYTGRENVMLNASVLGLSQEETLERLDAILAFADLGDFIDQPIKTYSSGMAMRLAFAVIAHIDADILVIDEALAVGDVYFQQKCMRWLRKFRETGTVLFCGHDTSAVTNLCQKALWLHEGTLRMSGSGKEVAEAYTAFMHAKAAGLPDEVGYTPAYSRRAELVADDNVEGRTDSGDAVEQPRKVVPEPPVDRPVVFDWMSESSSFGTRAAIITQTSLTHEDGAPLTWIEGGERVRLSLMASVQEDVESPIAGFIIKDRLGQAVSGTNTVTLNRPFEPLAPGEKLRLDFDLRLPRLASGRYTITIAIADGTLDSHVQLHWVHDAIVFDVHSRLSNGVIVAPDVSRVAITKLEHSS